MPKLKTLYCCQQCGHQSPRWQGRCPSCQVWNSLVEEVVEASAPSAAATEASLTAAPPTLLADVSVDEAPRMRSAIDELDRVLGGGIVPGSVVLVGGEPGIGKSTLLLNMAGALAAARQTVLYVSGEESMAQTKLRAARLGLSDAAIFLLAQTRLEAIIEAVKQVKPDVVIVDSVQVIETEALASAPGSVGQVRACAYALVQAMKASRIALFLVGHVTKDGSLAGPKVLEHLVDTVLYFEGEPTSGFRVLRSTKNRFGPTFELGVFHMTAEGLVQVTNPSELFLSDRTEAVPGCMVTVSLEGSRPMLVEVQALTSPCGIGLPRRRTTGIEFNRLSMLLAVLERRVGLHLIPQQDVFVSSLGGIQLTEPAADLAVAIAIASSLKEKPAGRRDVAIGEVGLTGEIRPVAHIAQRLHEAKRVGFTRCLVAAQRGGLARVEGLEIIPVSHVREAVAKAFD
jgi:DNA repair protein RadA/Sms